MSRNKVAVGSAPWILDERQQVDQFVEQEAEEFSYSVRNELEWLNEHMADIFSQNQVDVADVFKTPGKLRGKTPRTTRKKNPLEIRAPLTDIFAPNLAVPPSPAPQTQSYKQVEQIQIAEDPEPSTMASTSQSTSEANNTTNPMRPGDSGYHGMTEDEMEVDHEEVVTASPRKESPAKSARSSPLKQPEMNMNTKSASASFVSAAESVEDQEENANATPSKEESDEENMTAQEDEMDLVPTQPDESPVPMEKSMQKSPQYSVGDHTASALNSIMRAEQQEDEPEEEAEELEEADEPEEPAESEEGPIENTQPEEMEVDGARTLSEPSSPEQPFFRKSSITFSALPAREPLKKSMGSQGSRISQAGARNSYIGRLTGGKSLGGSHAILHGAVEDEAEKSVAGSEDPEASKLHSKTSTQRLHERINMLAQSKEPRSSKSIPSALGSQEPNYPQLPVVETSETAEKTKKSQAKEPSPVPETQEEDDEEDDWIAPVSKPLPAGPQRPALRKSQSVDVMGDVHDRSSIGALDEDLPEESDRPSSSAGSPAKPQLGLARSKTVPDYKSPAKVTTNNVEFAKQRHSSGCASDFGTPADASTPFGSPQRAAEGTQSAKSKFYSVLKSAKSIFASSAGVSAQAKMEALSPATMRLKQNAPPMEEVSSPRRPLSSVFDKPVNTAPPAHRQGAAETPVRRTRASFEREEKREKEAQEKRRAGEELEKLREQERKRATETANKEKEKHAAKSAKKAAVNSRPDASIRAEPVASNEEEQMSEDETPATQAPKAQPSAAGTQKLKEPRSRLVKPSKESIPKPRTHIKVGLGSQRGQPTNADLSKSLHGTLAPASKPAAESATNSFSRSIGPSGAPVAKPNSLALAAKNKEREEREAQRKAEKKRQIEQQRAAKLAKAEEERRRVEEERRAEAQRKAEEQKRAQEAKRAANRQALAAEARKQEQMRSQAASRQANDLATQLQHEKSKTLQSHPRGDMAGARPVSRMNTVQDFGLNRPVNPAKPAKRVFQPDDEETVSRPQVQRNPPTFQRLDAKRRKTDEDEEATDARRSMMAPPIRQSNVRKLYPERDRIMSVIDKAKDGPNKYSHGYMSAASGSHNQPSSMLKQTVTAQHHAAHTRPAAGHPNDMATISKAKIPFADPPPSAAAAGSSSSQQQTFKTPMGKTTTTTVKTASPHFPTPELPEIATDSEDSDSDSENGNGAAAGFRAPSWVNSPALRDLLTQQQLVDPMEVFGPIAPLQMEEIFKNKERHKRFRDRTSSANWSGSDRLTEDERRRDREARERMMKDGGWTYEGDAA
ncbi:hypothetical protein IWX90DRAFT_516281 [Phyllosticta citrichinensis]|uniref:Inner centromere protein ARK-binding domain-containing protein n=1 Tax=Phyllosticta citrichinensis TaxID=1130410 RepID=A0ABR1XLY4_9PEZI